MFLNQNKLCLFLIFQHLSIILKTLIFLMLKEVFIQFKQPLKFKKTAKNKKYESH